MTCPMFAGFVSRLFLGTVIFSAASSSAQKPSSSLRFVSVNVGQDVKLDCYYGDGPAVVYFWYKQTLGEKPQLISTFFKHELKGSLSDEFGKDARFALETGQGGNHLKISNVQTSDSATYYCISAYSYAFNHLEGIIVHVKGSGSTIQTSVHQSESETTRGSKTLSCTVHTGICGGEYNVYWFKDSGEALSREIYTHGSKKGECERNATTQTHTCVYNLPVKNVSDAGSYYCAVASCGHILFGKGTKLDFQGEKQHLVFRLVDEGGSLFLLYVLSGALAFSGVLVVFLAYTVYRTKVNKLKDPQERSTAPNAEDHMLYSALRDVTFSGRRKDVFTSECVYSGVRQ